MSSDIVATSKGTNEQRSLQQSKPSNKSILNQIFKVYIK